VQLHWVFQHDTFLAQRWEADDDGANLYHCANQGRSFFVKVGVDYGQEQPIVLRSFVSRQRAAGGLQPYVQLPEKPR
jgi:hypothetical protein